MPVNGKKNLLKVSEVASVLDVNSTTVLRWIERGYLKSIRYPSGSHRVPRNELQRLLNNRDQGRKKYRIALVDDDPRALDALEGMLAESGLPMEVFRSTDRITALLEMPEFDPDVIILDYRLDEIGGGTLANKISSSTRLNGVPIILVSDVAEELEPRSLGAQAFLVEPFRSEELNTVVKQCLRLETAAS